MKPVHEGYSGLGLGTLGETSSRTTAVKRCSGDLERPANGLERHESTSLRGTGLFLFPSSGFSDGIRGLAGCEPNVNRIVF